MEDEFETMSPMMLATVNLHELFTSMRESGFTEMQALVMLGVMLAHANQSGDSDDE